MKQDALLKIKATAFDWISKGLLALVLWFVKDMHDDVKYLMRTMPAHEVRLGNLEASRLIDRFNHMRIPSKKEDPITLDSLIENQN